MQLLNVYIVLSHGLEVFSFPHSLESQDITSLPPQGKVQETKLIRKSAHRAATCCPLRCVSASTAALPSPSAPPAGGPPPHGCLKPGAQRARHTGPST